MHDIDTQISKEKSISFDVQSNLRDNLNLARSLVVSLKGIQESSFEEEKQHRREHKQYYQLERRVAVLQQYKEKFELLKIEKVVCFIFLSGFGWGFCNF
jgi:hypothetical protein